jgi:hypothetical protein
MKIICPQEKSRMAHLLYLFDGRTVEKYIVDSVGFDAIRINPKLFNEFHFLLSNLRCASKN